MRKGLGCKSHGGFPKIMGFPKIRVYKGSIGIYRGYIGFRVSQNEGYLFEGHHKKDYNTLGSMLGSPYFGKLR